MRELFDPLDIDVCACDIILIPFFHEVLRVDVENAKGLTGKSHRTKNLIL
jgi:hypothetical protein